MRSDPLKRYSFGKSTMSEPYMLSRSAGFLDSGDTDYMETLMAL